MAGKPSSGDPRSMFTRHLMKHLAHCNLAEVLPVQLASGERPIVPALSSDRVSEISAKVASTGSANVCVEYKQQLLIVAFEDRPSGEQPNHDGLAQDVHTDITLGMLIDYARTSHGEQKAFPINIDFAGTSTAVPSAIKSLALA